MKTTLQACMTFVLLAFSVTTGLNAQNNNNLIVFSETGDRFYLVLNGLKYNQSPETNVKVTNLNAPMYKAKIIFENPKPDLEANVHIMWEGNAVNNKEFTYSIIKKGDKYKLKFISQTDMGAVNTYADNSVVYNVNGTAMPKPNAGISTNNTSLTTITNPGDYNANTTITTTTISTVNGQAVNMGVNVNGANVNINTNIPNAQVTTTTYSSSTTTTSYSSNSNINTQPVNPSPAVNNTGSGANGCAMPMHEGTFNSLTQSITKQSFEDSKLKIAKQAISAACVSAGQVKKIMGLFSYEESKLDLAKYAYKYTFDKQNYFKINDAFTYSSSIDDLTNYLNSQQ